MARDEGHASRGDDYDVARFHPVGVAAASAGLGERAPSDGTVHPTMTRTERGLTLLEVMVALVVLSLVGLAYLQLFNGGHRLVGTAREWSQAVDYAEEAMEQARLSGPNFFETPWTETAASCIRAV